MKITKFDHSCFYIEKDNRGLIFDPVEYTTKLPTITNLDCIIITHKHGDHFQPEVLAKLTTNNPNVKIFTTSDNTDAIDNSHVAKDGQTENIGVFKLAFFGNNHAPVYKNEIPCENIGTVVDDVIVNPADSFDFPSGVKPKILLTPISAPWLKLGEPAVYIETNKPEFVVNAHDAILSELGLTIANNWISQKSENVGANYKFLQASENLEI